MGWFHDVVHTVTHIARPIVDLHQNAADQVSGDAQHIADNNRNLATSIDSTNRNFFNDRVDQLNDKSQSLFYKVRDFVFFQGNAGSRVRGDIRSTVGDRVKGWWNHWGDEVHVIVNKWGGEQRVVGWGVVVVCVVVIIYSWGAATPYVMAICGPLMSYGVSAGLSPAPNGGGDVSIRTDNSRYNAQNDLLGGSDSGESASNGLLDSLSQHPVAVLGAIVAGGVALFFLLKR